MGCWLFYFEVFGLNIGLSSLLGENYATRRCGNLEFSRFVLGERGGHVASRGNGSLVKMAAAG